MPRVAVVSGGFDPVHIGHIRMFNEAKSRFFPSQRSEATAFAKVTITDKKSQFHIKKLRPGNYALAVYHDKDNNGKLDRSVFGKPKEAYGFSNNPTRPRRGPPSFEKAKFEIKVNEDSKNLVVYVKK